ncbi:asparagine synthase (glutamine-hydrolysing) [Gelidibacter sediminis]|uniref:asparagine synthase (glutamine-hydrolyzing) n=1 Tax=Gelidibacter sediminis TaxID=1608710 RepID=A0A4R7Q093_9FLAO|nr:asparagine synthase (glutamine-hydrolyzing) [Gelidibacter sediminis]TDU40009.1 asparagine synthase (glutamine-hydrolysing) [Gelidibacter sediminis]
MCGIYGTTLQYNEVQIKEKLQRTAFRGPDKMGWKYYSANYPVIFGHNRLSIIDLDPRSDQPFTYFEHIHIVFNGEIYNFKTLKESLSTKGYQFRTTSDTEVMCAAYLEYGEECVEHFNGMFSFVIFDTKKQLFFGARDRLGKKPFYYYHNGKNFEFASQISSIQLHHHDLTISSEAIAHYLAWGAIPDPKTIFNEVKKLLPGHSFTFQLATGEFKDRCYWDIDYQGKSQFSGSYEEAKTELKNILNDAVSTRLFADVSVGVFLSGGVDSSLISAIATQSTSEKVKTFSVKFNEKGFDESKYAQQVADHLKTDHHVIECNYDEGIDLIKNFNHYYDEPFADSSAIPSMLLAKHTRKQVTVALSGDGGDESFIGYHRYSWIMKGKRIHYLPLPLRQLGSKVLELSPNYRHRVIAKALKFKTIDDTYLAAMTGVDLSYLKTDIDYKDVEELKYLFHNNKNLLERVSDFDIKTYLNWDINTKVDRATMAYSLEARAPLMDHRVVDFARALPSEYKMHNGNQKRILKDILYESVPKEIFDRPKAGFTMPFSRWFREDLKDYVLSELDDNSLKSIPCIDIEEVKFRIKQHMDGTWDRYPLIWSLLVLKQWLNTNCKNIPIK